MSTQDNVNNGDEFPDANSGLDAVDLEDANAATAETGEAGTSPADAGEAASDSADEAPAAVGDEPQGEADFGDSGEGAGAGAAAANGTGADSSDQIAEPSDADKIVELTAALQSERASFLNYKKQSEQRNQQVGEVAVSAVLRELLPVLDDLDRAQEHGEYDGPLKSIGDSLQGVVTKLGLEKFGEAGEAFDPSVHEGLMAVEPAEGQDSQVVGQVLRPGYKVGDRVIRTAGVAVTN